MCIKRMHTYDAHGPPYCFSSSAVMQSRKACYTVVSCAQNILLRIYNITILATFGVTIFYFFSPWAPAYMLIFPNAQGQLIHKSFAGYCPLSNPSKILWLSSLTARIKKNQSKMKELEWSKGFPNYIYGSYLFP